MGDFLDNHIEDILAGMPSPKEIIQQELEEEIKRLNMFRLLSLTILHHRVLGNINLTFSQDENQEHYPEDIYTSVVIGANGIGKSFLLRAIADIFSFLDGRVHYNLLFEIIVLGGESISSNLSITPYADADAHHFQEQAENGTDATTDYTGSVSLPYSPNDGDDGHNGKQSKNYKPKPHIYFFILSCIK